MSNFFHFMTTVYSAILLNTVLAFYMYRHVNFHYASSTSADLRHTAAAASFFFGAGQELSLKANIGGLKSNPSLSRYFYKYISAAV